MRPRGESSSVDESERVKWINEVDLVVRRASDLGHADRCEEDMNIKDLTGFACTEFSVDQAAFCACDLCRVPPRNLYHSIRMRYVSDVNNLIYQD